MNIYLKLTTVRLLPNQTTSQKKQSQLTELSKFLEHKRADIHQNITWFLDNKNHNEITTLVNQIKNIFKCTKFQHVLNKLSNYFNHKTGGDKVNTSACINLLSEILKTNIANAEQITAGNKTIGGTNGTSAENVGNRFQLRTEYKSTNPSAFGDGGTLVDAVACRHIKPVQLALIQSGGGGSVAGAEIQKDLEHVTPTPTASGGGGTVAGAATPDVGSLETGPKTSIIPPDEEPTIFNILNHLITMFEESNHHPINLNKYLSQIDGSLHNKTLNLIQGLLVKLDEDSSDVPFEKFREFIQENKIDFLEDAIKSLISSKPQKIKKEEFKDSDVLTYTEGIKQSLDQDTPLPKFTKSIDRHLTDTSISIPSAKHPKNNEDQIRFLDLEDNQFMSICCDGVSNCGQDRNGNQITGEHTAYKLSECLTSEKIGNEIKEIVRQLRDQFQTSLEEESHPETQYLAIKNFTNLLIQQIDRIPLHPSFGNTTLEICFKLIINHKPFIITLSWGDSETIIYKNDGTLLQLNSSVINPRSNNEVVEIHKIKDLNQSDEFYKPFSDPIATIGFDSNNNPTVTYGELEPGDMIITCSDGLTDGISNLSHDKSSACLDKRFLKTLLDYCNLKKLNEQQTAAYLGAVAVICSPKLDDTTVSVKKII